MSNNTADNKMNLRIEMLSDWHIGTGAGIPGSVDAMLARDGDGFPCVPAKTIVGMWRDALEILTLGLDNGDPKKMVWQKWVDVIFGSQPNHVKADEVHALAMQNELTPRPAIVTIGPARLNENLRNAIGNDVRLRQALTFIKPNTAIDSASGTVKSETLRLTEMGRIGTVLEAEINLDFGVLHDAMDEQKELMRSLLVASATLVERIGGNRRRGSGKCTMQIEGVGFVSKEAAVGVIENYQLAQNVPEVKRQSSNLDAPLSTNGNGWKRIGYSLELHTPVAIVTNTLGNVSETLDFIPGTYLLPHITKQLKGISKYVASGDFQVSPATIQIDVPKKNDKGEWRFEGRRGLPAPKVVFHHKVDGGFDKRVGGGYDKKQEGEKSTVYNLITEREKVEDVTYQKKNYREGYVSTVDGSSTLPFYETTKKILLMHNTVDDSVQRPTENVGGVYSHQAIKAGTTLRGAIRLKKTIAEELSRQDEKWCEKLNASVRLGTSKKDDYGLAQLAVAELKDDKSHSVANGSKLIVYLESDVLLRNGNLRQTNAIDDLKTELEKTFGTGSLNKNEDVSLIQVRRIESWHEGWGFPRPTLTAMAAGSVAVFDVEGTIDDRKLQELELSGIGERRGEGYGRIRFNPPLLSGTINEWKVASKNGSTEEKRKQEQKLRDDALAKLKTEIINADKVKKLIETIEFAAWRDELARAVLKLAANQDQRAEIFGFEKSVPKMSQVGSLRSAIMRLQKPKDTNVISWINHLKATDNRLEKWDNGKNKQRAKEKLARIEKLINEDEFVWLLLEQTDSNGRPYWDLSSEFVTTKKGMQLTLWAEAVMSLFDACARAHKRDVERGAMKEDNANG